MLQKEYKLLDKSISNLKGNLRAIKRVIDKVLQRPERCFKVHFNNKDYTFYYPSTDQESKTLATMREELLTDILKSCVAETLDNLYADNQEVWGIVFAFVMGHPEEYYQIEKVSCDATPEERVDKEGNRVTSIPLDENNYHVRVQLQKECVKEKDLWKEVEKGMLEYSEKHKGSIL